MENSGNQEVAVIQGFTFRYDEPIFQKSTADQQLGVILMVQPLILVVFCLIFLVASVVKYFAPSKSYTAELVSLRDIFMKMDGIGNEKGTKLINSFYISMISLSIVSLFLILLGLLSLLSERFPVIYLIELILVPICYVYVVAMCVMSLVISLSRNESNGVLLRASAKVKELVQENRIWAYAILLLLSVIVVTILIMSVFVVGKLGIVGRAVFAVTIPCIWLIFLLKQLRGMLLEIRSLSKDRGGIVIEESSGLTWFDYLFGDDAFADLNALRSKLKKPSSHDSSV